MKLNLRSFSLRVLLALVLICALCAAFYARHLRMNTPHRLALGQRIDFGWEIETPAAPVFYLNPPRAREVAKHYQAKTLSLLNSNPPGTQYYINPAIRHLASQSPEVLPRYFEAWFSPDTSIETLFNATQIVYHIEHAAGIEKAKQEIIRRLETLEDSKEIDQLCILAWEDPALLPSVEQVLHRLPHDPKVVWRAVMILDELGSYESLELPEPAVELLKSWLENGDENQKYIASHGLAYTPFRETEAVGDQIRSQIAAGERLFHGGQTILHNNPAPWVLEAFAELQAGSGQQPQFAEILCKYGGEESVDFFQAQLKKYASRDAMFALKRVQGKEKAVKFLRENLSDKPLHRNGLLLEIAGEDAIDDCIDTLANSDDTEMQKCLIVEIDRRKLGKGNPELIDVVEKAYRNACETDFRINARLMLNALTRLGHPEPKSLAELLPEQGSFESYQSPAVTMAENDLKIQDFVDFLNSRQDEPIDATTLGDSLDLLGGGTFEQEYILHEALIKTSFAMDFDSIDWMSSLEPLYHELVLLTDSEFVPDGIRSEKELEISWKNIVFCDELAQYESGPGGLIEMLNAMLDHSGETDARFVAYPNKSGNERPTIVFLTAADVKTLEIRFGLKPARLSPPK